MPVCVIWQATSKVSRSGASAVTSRKHTSRAPLQSALCARRCVSTAARTASSALAGVPSGTGICAHRARCNDRES